MTSTRSLYIVLISLSVAIAIGVYLSYRVISTTLSKQCLRRYFSLDMAKERDDAVDSFHDMSNAESDLTGPIKDTNLELQGR